MLENADPRKTVGIAQQLAVPPGVQSFFLAANVGCRNVLPGPNPGWQAAAIYLVGRTASGSKVYPDPYTLFAGCGTRRAERYAGQFAFPEPVEKLTIYAMLVRTTGEMTVSGLSMSAGRVSATYRIGYLPLALLWAVVILSGGWLLVSTIESRWLACLLVCAVSGSVVLLLMSAVPREAFLGLVSRVLHLQDVDQESVADWGHFTLFVIMSGITALGARRQRRLAGLPHPRLSRGPVRGGPAHDRRPLGPDQRLAPQQRGRAGRVRRRWPDAGWAQQGHPAGGRLALSGTAGPPGSTIGWPWPIVAVLLAVITTVLFTWPDHYVPLGGERLLDGTFAGSGDGPPAGWETDRPDQVLVRGGVLALEATRRHPSVYVRQSVATKGEEIAWRLTAELRTLGVVAGPEGFERARVYLLGRQADGTFLADPQGDLLRLAGTTDWTTYAGTVPAPGEATAATVIVRLHQAPGSVELRRISLVGLGLAPAFKRLAAVLALCWAAVILWEGALLARQADSRPLFGGLAVAGVIGLVLLVAPHIVREQVIGWSARALNGLLPKELVAKLGHFLIFAIVAGLLRLSSPRSPPALQLGILLLAASIGEVLQFLSVGRTPSLRDLAVNVAGVRDRVRPSPGSSAGCSSGGPGTQKGARRPPSRTTPEGRVGSGGGLDRALGHHVDEVRPVLGAGVDVAVQAVGRDLMLVDRAGREVRGERLLASLERNTQGRRR